MFVLQISMITMTMIYITDINDYQDDIDDLNTHAQLVFRVGGDTYVNSQAQQLTTRYQNVSANCKVS